VYVPAVSACVLALSVCVLTVSAYVRAVSAYVTAVCACSSVGSARSPAPRARTPARNRPVIIVMTAFESGALRKLPANRVHAVLHKPFDVERVVELVRDCAFVRRDERETAEEDAALPPMASAGDEEAPVC
jgi:hypothetical protein